MPAVSKQHLQEVLDTADCLHDKPAVDAALDAMAEKIKAQYKDKNPLVITLMNGGMITSGHLLIRLDFILQVDFIHASRYREKTAGTDIMQWLVEPHQTLEGRHILLVDDILDEGMTLYEVVEYCRQRGAASVASVVLIDKKHDRRTPEGFVADFTGLEIEDRYVFGYGMDYKGYLRNAAGIYAVAENLLEKN